MERGRDDAGHGRHARLGLDRGQPLRAPRGPRHGGPPGHPDPDGAGVMRLLRRTGDETGVALPVAMILMLIMSMLGVAALSYANGQTRASLRERVGESQFNM